MAGAALAEERRGQHVWRAYKQTLPLAPLTRRATASKRSFFSMGDVTGGMTGKGEEHKIWKAAVTGVARVQAVAGVADVT